MTLKAPGVHITLNTAIEISDPAVMGLVALLAVVIVAAVGVLFYWRKVE